MVHLKAIIAGPLDIVTGIVTIFCLKARTYVVNTMEFRHRRVQTRLVNEIRIYDSSAA